MFANATKTFGIILGAENYDACLSFYRDALGLPVWYDKGHLCSLRLGDGYLMIESGGVSSKRSKIHAENPTTLCFNVEDVEAPANDHRSNGVDVDVKIFSWGQVGTFHDPDGNKCELKNTDDPFFA